MQQGFLNIPSLWMTFSITCRHSWWARHSMMVGLNWIAYQRASKRWYAIRYHDSENCLIHLRDTIPFTRDRAPTLFAGVIDNPAPPELWMMFQDCFFENPGLHNILHEFLPEEDWAPMHYIKEEIKRSIESYACIRALIQVCYRIILDDTPQYDFHVIKYECIR